MGVYFIPVKDKKEREYTDITNDKVINVFNKNSGKDKKQWIGDLILNDNNKIVEFRMNDHLVLELPDILFIARYVNNFNNK